MREYSCGTRCRRLSNPGIPNNTSPISPRSAMSRICSNPTSFNRTTVVILNGREPGLGRLAGFIEQQQVKGSMIGLPHGVGVRGLSPIEQVKLLAVHSSPLMGHREERRIKVL